jgi:hypothetical protein
MQHEITMPGPLLNERGELAQRGYARRPVLDYDPRAVGPTRFSPVNRLRLKEWDYYGVTTPDWFFSICVSHVGYIGLAFAYFIDFTTLDMPETQAVTPLGYGVTLPTTSRGGDINFSWLGARVSFLRRRGTRRLHALWPNFGKRGGKLKVDLVVRQPEEIESIVMATPMEHRCFYYNEKINCMPAEGTIELLDRRLEVRPDRALASLDWGRGVWPYRTFWNWGSASGFLPDGRRIGLNLGEGFGDLSAATENCFFIDGRMEKLGAVKFQYDPNNYMKPWRFTDDEGRCDLTLTPFFDRTSNVNLLVAGSRVHQMFGRYSGRLLAADGREIRLDNLIGWAEEHYARW